MISKANIDWSSLSFSYVKTDYSYISKWSNGKWDDGEMITENTITISQSSAALHYGQECFEGLKAYERKDGKFNLFRPSENAKRINNSCKRLMMPEVPVEKFIDACVKVVEANIKYVPPYGTGATLYLRPFIIGVGDNLGVRSAPEFIFCVFCSPVGPYFKGGMKPIKLSVSDFDRAAPYGTGGVKCGGNYAASLLPHSNAAQEGYSDCIYLDPATHTKIEEVGAANFFGITKDNKFVTPKSPSILPSITKYSLMALAKDYFKLQTEERDVYIDKLDEFAEAGACGTAAVISPIGSIRYKNNNHVFYSETEVGPITKKLYDCLTGIQFGDVKAPEGWIVEI